MGSSVGVQWATCWSLQEQLAASESGLDAARTRQAQLPSDAGGYLHAEVELRKREVEEQRRRVADPQASSRRKVTGINRGLVRESRPGPQVALRSGVRYVNGQELPPPLAGKFQDREAETDRLAGLLGDDAVRVVVVVGPDGVGKTAIVSRLLDPPEGGNGSRSMPAEAVVYLPVHGARPITAAVLLTCLRRALPSQRASGLTTMLEDEVLTSEQKLEVLLERISNRRVVVAFDNVEDLLDGANGEFRDPELREVLSALVGRRQHGVKVVLITRTGTEPRPLLRGAPVGEVTLPVERGLPYPHAERFLRGLDVDGIIGRSRENLAAVRKLTDGRPRALEALYFLLARGVALPGLLEEMEAAGPPDAVVDLLVGRMLNSLDNIDRLVIQALAVYGRPVLESAVDHLIEPYLPGYQSRLVLQRLLRQRLVRRQGGRWFVPATDHARVLRGIPPGQAGDHAESPARFTRAALLHRAADYFADVRALQGEITSIDDLNPYFMEIDLRLRARDLRTALELMDEVDSGWLRGWGFRYVLSNWRKSLVGRLGDPLLEAGNLDALGDSCRQRDKQNQAIRYFEKALPLVAETEFADQLLPALHINLGGALTNINRHEAAREHYDWARRAAETADLPDLQAQAWSGLSICAAESGRFGEALDHFALARELIEGSDDPSLGPLRIRLLLNAGYWYGQLGEPEHALEYLHQGREEAAAQDERLLEGQLLDAIAEVLIDQAHLGMAIDLARRAVAIGRQLSSPPLLREASVTLAQAHLCAGSVAKALSVAEAAIQYRASRRSLRAFALYGITALRIGDPAIAKVGLTEAHQEAMRLRRHHKQNFAALDIDGLALCGLVLCKQPRRLDEATASFRAARLISSEPGVVRRTVRLLDELGVADEQGVLAVARESALGR